MKFFESVDIEEFGKWADREYCKPDSYHQKFMANSMKPLFLQTKHWAEETAKRLPAFAITTGRYLKRGRKAGTTQTVPVFQKYTWAMIFPKEYKDLGVYFTVDVDTDSNSLLYKLDCERISSSFSKKRKLSETQQAQCRSYISDNGGLSRQIEAKELLHRDWNSLVEETKIFVEDHLIHYNKLIKIIGV